MTYDEACYAWRCALRRARSHRKHNRPQCAIPDLTRTWKRIARAVLHHDDGGRSTSRLKTSREYERIERAWLRRKKRANQRSGVYRSRFKARQRLIAAGLPIPPELQPARGGRSSARKPLVVAPDTE